MAISNQFLRPSRRTAGISGTPTIECRRLNMSVEENWYPLSAPIKIDRDQVKAAFPAITDDMLTKELMFDFVKGGLPLSENVPGQEGYFYFDAATSLSNPTKVVSDAMLGNTASKNRILVDIIDDGVTFYVKNSSSGRDRISLFGKQGKFSMNTDLKPFEATDFTNTKNTDGSSITADQLKEEYSITPDFARLEGQPVRSSVGYSAGSKVTFKFCMVDGAWGWVVVPDANRTSGWYITDIPNGKRNGSHNLIAGIDTVNLKYKEIV